MKLKIVLKSKNNEGKINGNKELVKQFEKIKFSWSRINKVLYDDIQNDIDSILEKNLEYRITCHSKIRMITLPKNKIEVEFIVWSQERLNEVFGEIIRYIDYFDRLGLKLV